MIKGIILTMFDKRRGGEKSLLTHVDVIVLQNILDSLSLFMFFEAWIFVFVLFLIHFPRLQKLLFRPFFFASFFLKTKHFFFIKCLQGQTFKLPGFTCLLFKTMLSETLARKKGKNCFKVPLVDDKKEK